MKLGVITEEQANYYVEIALKNININNIVSIKCYIDLQAEDSNNIIRYEVYYLRKIKDNYRKVLLPLTYDHYYILLHKGLTLEGYQVNKIKRRIIDEKIYYGVSYSNNLEKPDFIKR